MTDEQHLDEAGILVAMTQDPLAIEPVEYRYHDLEWLLSGDALVEHIEYALALVSAPERASSRRRRRPGQTR